RATSPVEDFTRGHFREVLDDATVDAGRVRRVVLCSGKVYYDLLERREEKGLQEVAIVRLEQFYAWPEELLKQTLSRYRRGGGWVWAREESQNMGGWPFVEPRLRALGFAAEYVGRDASSSPATGSLRVHRREQQELVDAALQQPAPYLVRAA